MAAALHLGDIVQDGVALDSEPSSLPGGVRPASGPGRPKGTPGAPEHVQNGDARCNPRRRLSNSSDNALTNCSDILGSMADARQVVILLDYDGTLTPIVNEPDRALLPERNRRLLERLTTLYPTGVVTGRSLPKILNFVKVHGLFYAGSHGFDIQAPDELSTVERLRQRRQMTHAARDHLHAEEHAPLESDSSSGSTDGDGEARSHANGIYHSPEYVEEGAHVRHQVGIEAVPSLQLLRDAIAAIIERLELRGALVEDNVFSVSVHYRNCPEDIAHKVELLARCAVHLHNCVPVLHEDVVCNDLVEDIVVLFHDCCEHAAKTEAGDDKFGLNGVWKRDKVAQVPLRLSEGKKVWELRPDVHWDKGQAVLWVLRTLEGLREKQQDGGLASDSEGSTKTDVSDVSLKPNSLFTIYIGDDKTDEDAFAVFSQGGAVDLSGIGIVVTEDARDTEAHYTLRDPSEVTHFLERLCEHAESALPSP